MTGRSVRSARCYLCLRSCDTGSAERADDRFEATQTNRSAGRHCCKSLSLLPTQPASRRSIKLCYVLDVSNNNIRAGHKVWQSGLTACCMGGMTIDFVSPLTSWSIWIGCIAAPMEIVPANEPASDGIPSVLANCFERRSLPPVMVSDLPAGIVIVLVSFNVEKGESCIAIANCKIEALT